MDLVRVAGDADNALPAPLVNDRHVNAREHTGEHLLVGDHDHILRSVDNAVGHFMIGPDPLGIPAGYDHAGLIHDIDIVFCVLRDLLDESAGHFRFDHFVPPCRFVSRGRFF